MKKIRTGYPIRRARKRVGSAFLLLCMFTLFAWSHRFWEPEQYDKSSPQRIKGMQNQDKTDNGRGSYTEDKERNRKVGLNYTVDETHKETLTSDNGEICVKIPHWEEFETAYLTENYGKEKLYMSNAVNYDSMTYELLATWDIEEAENEILGDFIYHVREHILGKIYHMTVDGIDIYYLPCYHDVNSKWVKWHYIVWADLGCGQVLKAEFTQGILGEKAWKEASEKETITCAVSEPLNIEGVIEALYAHVEVCSAEGEPIAIAYRDTLPDKEEKVSYNFSFGTAREYRTDAYRETAVCAELIENLYEAVQAGAIQELLEREKLEETELSIAEKIDYIKKEETGRLVKYDSGNAYVRGEHPTKCYLMKGADASKEFLVYSGHDFWEDRFDYIWFQCEKDNSGKIRAQKGIYIYGAGTNEHYFLAWQGNPYLCIANRDAEGEIKSVVLYDFQTSDYIGTIIHVDDSSVRICSYIRNEGSYGTEMPWYLYDNRIDSGKEYFAMLESWKITEYLGESDYCHVEDNGAEIYAGEQEITQRLKDAYLDKEIDMSWNPGQHDVTSFHSASEYGYYYTSWNNLYKVYGQPETLDMEAPFTCATLQAHDFEENIDIIVDKNGKAAIYVEGRFFRLEKSVDGTKEIRTWE